MKTFLISLFMLTVVLFGCTKNEEKPLTTNMETVMSEQKNDSLYVATIKTTLGTMKIELYADKAPKTVENFVGLARKGFYNGIIFHRVIKNFMIQGGDPTGTGRGGESIYGKEFGDEFDPTLKHDVEGILSMANRGPNTNTSQFFITLVPTPWLDGKHTVFGKVIEGLDVLRAIGAVQTGQMDKPVTDVVMEEVTIEASAAKTE